MLDNCLFRNHDSQCIQNHAALEYCVGLFVILHFCVLDLILQEAERTNMEQTGHGDEEEQTKGDETGLFLYHKKQKKSTHFSPAAQLNHYLDNCDGQNCLLFWGMNKEKMPSLFQIAMRVLAVPASSAPVERVFSHGGIIMRPHHSQLSAIVLANLIFCKCNTF